MMKRIWIAALALLLLAGCARGPEAGETTSQIYESAGLYQPGTPLETSTSGAVRVYSPETAVNDIAVIGQNLLLVGADGTLTLLSGPDGEVTATRNLGQPLSIGAPTFSVGQTGVAYYDTQNFSVVIYTPKFAETGAVSLPEDMSGLPLISLPARTVYYCSADEIRALDMDTGISRLIKKQTCISQQLTGALFNGTVLICRVTTEQGEDTLYLSAETGETLARNPVIPYISTSGGRYLLRHTDGIVSQVIFGTKDGQKQTLSLPDGAEIAGIPEPNLAVSWTAEDDSTVLSCYDLGSGTKTAQVSLPGITDITSVTGDQDHIWFLAQSDSEQILCRWEHALSPAQDTTIYSGTVYTAEAPDTEGIAACKEEASALTDTYGLRFRFWTDALEETGDHVCTGEYQVPAMRKFLEEMKTALTQFPENFLRSSLRSGRIYFSLVRDIPSDEEYLLEYSGGNVYIIFDLNTNITESLLDAAGYLVDSHVLGNSRAYDEWDSLNPPSFSYGQKPAEHNLTDDYRYFISEESGQSPREDRQSIFAYAMQADKANYFKTTAMQNKLRKICVGIREAYDLEKKDQVFPWEQHLSTPIEPKK